VGVLAFLFQDPAGLDVAVEAPTTVASGETFDLNVTVTNQGDSAITVSKIELPSDLSTIASITGVEPSATSAGPGSYQVAILLQPGESRVVTFQMQALAPGEVSGDLNVYVGSRYKVSPVRVAIGAVPVVEDPTQAAIPTEAVSPGEIAGIPYRAVVQIIALVDLEGELVQGWTGSGSIVSKDGLILTNAHVVLSDRYYTVQSLVVALTVEQDALPQPTYVAKIMQVDEALDIAVIRIETDLDGNPVDRSALNLPTVPMGNDDMLKLGDGIVILGYPSIGGSTITITRGEVAGFTAEEGYGNRAFIKTSATISGGNSGGLAANGEGEIIGIPTQLGYGGDDQYVDCRVLVDTNRDGVVDENDNCVPTGGFINALRPLRLARPLIEAAARGEINIQEGVEGEEASIPEEQGNTVVFADDFSDPNSGWDDSAWEDGAVTYANQEYHVSVYSESWLVWSYLGEEMNDLIISVDSRIENPTGVGDYGVICRLVDDQNFYALEVSEDGYFSVWKKVNGETTTLYDWEFSDSIPVDVPFRIDAACVGNRLLLGVNDVLLADITDDSLTGGKYGLIAGTLDASNLTIAFDNYTVYEP
jgi:S1-C subfamily serine protease